MHVDWFWLIFGLIVGYVARPRRKTAEAKAIDALYDSIAADFRRNIKD